MRLGNSEPAILDRRIRIVDDESLRMRFYETCLGAASAARVHGVARVCREGSIPRPIRAQHGRDRGASGYQDSGVGGASFDDLRSRRGRPRRMMNLSFEPALAASYRSAPQKVRVLSEKWVRREGYCPSCGSSSLAMYANNNPAADFSCDKCREEYELKSKKGQFGSKVVDGAYKAMLAKLGSKRNPNLLLLNYDVRRLEVRDLIIVPKHFFVSDLIEQRKPLSAGARRAGWVGCNILLERIPEAGRIFLVKKGRIEPKQSVLANWKRTLFLREESDTARGWLLEVMHCIEKLGKPTFSLGDVYGFEAELSQAYPGNRHIREKIRQQLQVLRDKRYLDFLGKGMYRLAETSG